MQYQEKTEGNKKERTKERKNSGEKELQSLRSKIEEQRSLLAELKTSASRIERAFKIHH